MAGDNKTVIKHNAKDSVFTDLFGNTKYVLKLYNALHPDATGITEDMIEIVTLKNTLVNGRYNDLGFMVDKRLIVLAEAQSTWSVNIIIRALMYLVDTYQDYIEKEGVNVYGTKRIDFPRPELYVIYTGGGDVSEGEITLTDEFFGGREAAIEVRVKVITTSAKGDIINQYIAFTHVLDEQVEKYGRTEKAVKETIGICKERDILKEYLTNREREVQRIMSILYDEEYIQNAREKEVRMEGREEGIKVGEARGRTEGRTEGIDAMIANLRKAGISEEAIQNAAKMSRT